MDMFCRCPFATTYTTSSIILEPVLALWICLCALEYAADGTPPCLSKQNVHILVPIQITNKDVVMHDPKRSYTGKIIEDHYFFLLN
jgi:hypothetical protein